MKVKAILVFVFFSYLSFGQSPQKFTYQSIIKNSSGYLLKNQDVGLRISVLSNSSNGIEVYSEEHFPTSNSNGLVTLIIGEGLTNDNFSEIQWGDGEYFLKVEVDPEGGNSYIMNQTSQLLSVPYALYAGNSGSKLNLLGQDFITLQDQTLTVNKVDLTDDINGVLPITNGGTGSSTAPMVGVITAVDSPAARVVLGLGTASTEDATAFATAAQGALADSAQQPPSEGAFVDGDKSKLDGITASANNYSLPDATASTLGGIKVGTNLAIDSDGVLSSTDTNTTYSVGDGGLTENDFTDALKSKLDGITASANNYSLPDATASTLGGIKVGTNLAIDSDGVLSSTDTNTTYSVGDGGLTENDFTDALKSKVDNLGTISTQDFDAVNIDGGTIDGTSTTQSLGDNSAKIATTAYVDNSLSTRDNLSEILANGNTTGGSDIIISSGDDISFSDTSKAFFGSDNDLQLYHNGSHNYFTNSTGNFEITSTGSLILQDANSAKWMMTNQNGSVLLYHNGTSKLSTTSSGISVTGNINSSGSTNPTITVSDNTNSHYLTLQGLDNASKIDYLSTLIFEYGSNNTEIARLTSTGLEITGGVTANKLSANNKTITPAGTVGNQTINSTAGSVNFGSSDTTLTVTNNLADDNSVIMLTRGTAISANRNMSVVPSSGQFIITLDASFGIETKIFFLIIN
ncbi:head fiber protein [Flavobacteriaceae bacterium]|nr:head fiber protein [Flavobacteriaceae bacterium]